MIDWRTILKANASYPQNPQNSSAVAVLGNIKDIEDRRDRVEPSDYYFPKSHLLTDVEEKDPKTGTPSHSPDSSPAMPNPSSLPNGYCRECGGGRWIRETHASGWQCERCAPADPHVDYIRVSGGTPHLAPPIEAGWLVAYRDRAGKLCGGSDDRARGTVASCKREGGRWVVALTNGQQHPLSNIRGIVATYPNGSIRACWTVREYGYNGNGDKHNKEVL